MLIQLFWYFNFFRHSACPVRILLDGVTREEIACRRRISVLYGAKDTRDSSPLEADQNDEVKLYCFVRHPAVSRPCDGEGLAKDLCS